MPFPPHKNSGQTSQDPRHIPILRKASHTSVCVRIEEAYDGINRKYLRRSGICPDVESLK